MTLPNNLIDEFVKVMNDSKPEKKKRTLVGQIVEYNPSTGKTYVQLSNSTVKTPVILTTDAKVGDIVTVEIEDHVARVVGNTSCPASARTATNFMEFSEDGLVIGDLTDGSLGENDNNLRIDSDSVDIRKGEKVLSSFGVEETDVISDINTADRNAALDECSFIRSNTPRTVIEESRSLLNNTEHAKTQIYYNITREKDPMEDPYNPDTSEYPDGHLNSTIHISAATFDNMKKILNAVQILMSAGGSKSRIGARLDVLSSGSILIKSDDMVTIGGDHIYFNTEKSGLINVDDLYNSGATLLWSGNRQMIASDSQAISLTGDKALSNQKNGYIFTWSTRDSSGNISNTDILNFIVPKTHVSGMRVWMTDAYRGLRKAIYIYDDTITGASTNNQAGTANGIAFNNASYYLSKITGF